MSLPPANTAPTNTRFVVLAGLCAAAALSYVARNAIAVAESTVRADLGLTKEQSGWLMSAFFFSYALCQIPAAQFGQRVGPRRALPLFAALWSVATAVSAFAGGLVSFVALRIVQGVAQAGLVPVSAATVAKWFPKTGRALATGALGSFMSVGSALCAWLTGVLLEALQPHVGPGWNWRLTFLLFGVPGLLWAVWFWQWFRDQPREHRSVNEAELRLIESASSSSIPASLLAPALPPDGGEGAKKVAAAPGTRAGGVQPPPTAPDPQPGGDSKSPAPATPWLELFSSPALWWICGQQACRAAGYMFFTSWFATYLQETRGVGIAKSGFLNMLPLLAVVVGGIAGGALSDWLLQRTGSRAVARKFMGAVCLFICALFIFSSMFIADALLAVLVISGGSFFAALAGPCSYTITIDMGGPHVAAVNATMNMCGNFGAWAFPIAVPWLLKEFGSWDAVVVVFGACYAAGAALWLLLQPEGDIVEQALVRSVASNRS